MLLLKVCGMRDEQNIAELMTIRPHFLGFIFHEASSRNVIEPININFPENINKVGVFVDKKKEFILDKIKKFNLDYIQLHGKESPGFCSEFQKEKVKIIKAFNIDANFDFTGLKEYENHCEYFLFDASGKKAGGNGITFNWELLDKYTGLVPFLLSGGIDEKMAIKIKNVSHSKLFGIDINSGFETAPAYKNINKIKEFTDELYG